MVTLKRVRLWRSSRCRCGWWDFLKGLCAEETQISFCERDAARESYHTTSEMASVGFLARAESAYETECGSSWTGSFGPMEKEFSWRINRVTQAVRECEKQEYLVRFSFPNERVNLDFELFVNFPEFRKLWPKSLAFCSVFHSIIEPVEIGWRAPVKLL